MDIPRKVHAISLGAWHSHKCEKSELLRCLARKNPLRFPQAQGKPRESKWIWGVDLGCQAPKQI